MNRGCPNRTTLGTLALEVLEEHVQALRVLAVVADDHARAANNLPGVALTVDLAKTSPSAEGLGVRDLEEVDVVLVAESLNQLDVLGLVASLAQDTEVSLAAVERLGSLTEAASKAVMDERLLQHLLESILNAHRATGSGSRGLLGLLDLDIHGGLFNVRHDQKLLN
mgnify:CR=1 FL=1